MRPLYCKCLALLTIFLRSTPGMSGDIILVSEHYNFICKVEVAVGPDSPDVIEQVHELPGVQPGGENSDSIVFTGEGRLCYRRSSMVDDCYSELNDWVCYTNYRDEAEIISIF